MGGVGRAVRRGGWRWAGRAELKRRAQEQGAGERGPFPNPQNKHMEPELPLPILPNIHKSTPESRTFEGTGASSFPVPPPSPSSCACRVPASPGFVYRTLTPNPSLPFARP